MLSDEERKAIDYLQFCYDLSTITNESLSKLGVVLNLIEKQSKEIEELKEENNTTIVLEANRRNFDRVYNLGKIYTNKKWEDKIKAKTIEIKNRPVKDEFITASQGKLNTIIDMESLLEKE